MTDTQIFSNPQFGEIRTLADEANEPLFCLADLCAALGISNHRNVKARLDEDDVRLMDTTDNLGRPQQVIFVTESGMYDVILRSDAEKAKPFRKWLTSDVIPSIRKTGGYIVAKADDTPEMIMARAVIVAQATIEKQNKQIAEQSAKIEADAPKVLFADAVVGSKSTCLIGELAKIISQNGYPIGQNRLFQWLRENGYLGKHGERYNIPNQQYVEMGLFELKKGVRSGNDGVMKVTMTTKVTGKGQQYFINKFLNIIRIIMANSFTYTAPYSEAHVSADLSAMAMLFIELMCQQQEQNKSYGELIRTKEALAQFGFKNSQNAKLLGAMTGQMAEYKKATDTLAFMEEVWQKFGSDAMVVRYDHFFQILEKYDMVCGSFDRYTGGIPQSALDTLTRLNGMWERKELGRDFVTPYKWGLMFSVANENTMVEKLRAFLRMPIRTTKQINDLINAAIGVTGGELDTNPNAAALADVLFIAAPAADMKPPKMEVDFETDKLKELRRANSKTSTGSAWNAMFADGVRYGSKEYYRLRAEYDRLDNIRRKEIRDIDQAVKDEEERLQAILANSDINRYAKISFIHKAAEIVRILKDPFICSLTPHGVLIHAKWGAEAEDATIKRYEQLRDAIIGKGGLR